MSTTPFTYSPSVWIVPSILVLLLWSVFGIEVFWHLDLAEFGIYPRHLSGLLGVFCSPFIHGDISHLFNNTVPLFLLTAAMVYFYRNISLKVLFYGILVSGLLTWIIGRESYHIGASGLIYVLVSFIFFKGIQTKYYRLVALSLTVVVVYGGMIWYIFPIVDSGISWEGHLSGLLTGFVFVHLFQTPHYTKVIRYDWENEEFDPMQDGFMKHFDAEGNFHPLPKAEETETESSTASLPFVSIHYEYKKSKK